ncbi:hypothetical protein F2P81_005805 [Scophthalmus maximus]|uniref:Fork-head domain-containing protein n=1 Tax=Scophthalmus maximus TaxID=52904 RepID=A0A6A4T898_SCOMX|nr:hypothetical protein F2P81_005805 [Scophthalmus maximus]
MTGHKQFSIDVNYVCDTASLNHDTEYVEIVSLISASGLTTVERLIFICDLVNKITMEDRSSHTSARERLGLSFTIDYLLFNKGVKGSKEEATGSRTEEQTANNMLNHQNPEPEEVGIRSEKQEKQLQRSGVDTEERKVKEEEGEEEQQEEGEEEVTTTTSISSSPEKSVDKPNQSYIALISKAILASEQKKLLLCDIYQWIMDHYPYFKSKLQKSNVAAIFRWSDILGTGFAVGLTTSIFLLQQDKNWRNSVRHNLSLNDCFIKAGRSDNERSVGAVLRPQHSLCPARHPDSTGPGPVCSRKWGSTRASMRLYRESK